MRDFVAGGYIKTGADSCTCGTPLPCVVLIHHTERGEIMADHVPPLTWMYEKHLAQMADGVYGIVKAESHWTVDGDVVRLQAANGSWIWRVGQHREAVVNVHGRVIGHIRELRWPD